MIQRYLKILSYGIKLSKLYLVLRIFQLILSSHPVFRIRGSKCF